MYKFKTEKHDHFHCMYYFTVPSNYNKIAKTSH